MDPDLDVSYPTLSPLNVLQGNKDVFPRKFIQPLFFLVVRTIPPEMRSKDDPKSQAGIFLGYSTTSTEYLFYEPKVIRL